MDWEREQRHLDGILAVARARWEAVTGQSRERERAMEAVRAEMLERVTYDIGGLYSAQGFLDLLELNQAAQPLREAAAAQGMDDQALRSLARILDAPYFAGIDFQMEGTKEPMQVYIGRATLMEKLKIHVFDWRTPIASVFYRYGVGPAQYEAPAGTVRGQLRLKRQYEIRQGTLRYFFDADVQVMDAFLRELLSQRASAAMKSIVETIQRDQDMVIRDMESDLLMVQGTAGSGKTSVALHRVAYLMYQGLAEKRLSSHDILILSPNAVFERYISHVLPELGENQVETALFEGLFQRLLPRLPIQSRGAWVEARLENPTEIQDQVRAFKGSRAFVTLMERFLWELPRRWIPFQDVGYAGRTVAFKDLARAMICNTKKQSPLTVRLRWLEDSIWDQVHALYPQRMERLTEFTRRFPQHALEPVEYARMLSIREHSRLLSQVRSFTRVNVPRLYRALMEDAEAFQCLGKGIAAPEILELARRETLAALQGKTLAYQDAAAMAYLQARVLGQSPFSQIRQVVVDEAQDVDALHTALLKLLFPKARFTILGDVHQTLAHRVDQSLYQEMREILEKPASTLVTLNKSFRCTHEIWDFSSRFLPEGQAGECFSRSGEKPGIHAAANEEALLGLLRETAQARLADGHASVALVCKTERAARKLYSALKGTMSIGLMTDGAGKDATGVFVIPLYVAKGLEFDAVLVVDADAARYHRPEDRSLLYVACTRALHRLDVFYAGERSPLLPKEEDA